MILGQVPPEVQKSMNDCHDKFDESKGGMGLETGAGGGSTLSPMDKEARKWMYYILDFSTCKKKQGPISSKLVFADATDKEILDYDLIEVPLVWKNKKAESEILQNETILGFKVGIDSGARKTKRTTPGMSALAKKRKAKLDAAAAAAAQANAAAPAKPMNLG